MDKINYIEGKAVLKSGVRIGVICSRFNHFIVDKLEAGCLDALDRQRREHRGNCF